VTNSLDRRETLYYYWFGSRSNTTAKGGFTMSRFRFGFNTVSAFPCFLLLSFLVLLPAVSFAGGTLSLQKRAVFEKGSGATDAVKNECNLETKIPEFVQSFAKKDFDKINMVDTASAGTPGKALSIRITGVSGSKGGTTTGPKNLTIKGTLWQNGKVAGTFSASRFTTGGVSWIGYKGTCSMLGRCAKTLGKDVAGWLREPSMNAKLGDVR